MNQNQIPNDDPRLTAYALGEMEPAEAAEFERRLAGDEAARRQLDEIRAATGEIGRALEHEPLPVVEARGRTAVLPAYQRPRVFPYYWVSGLAAAGFAVVFLVWQANHVPPETKYYTEINLGEPGPGATAPGEASGPLSLGLATDDDASGAGDRAFIRVAEHPRSRVPLRVGRESYAAVREGLQAGRRPAPEAVRIEEMINHFRYDYPVRTEAAPFATALEVAAAPWTPEHRLVRIGLRGRQAGAGSPSATPVARGVSLEVDFNPTTVHAYRLLGYEEDAGRSAGLTNEQGAGLDVTGGQEITALYEVVPVASSRAGAARSAEADGRLLTVRLRYRIDERATEQLLELPLHDRGQGFEEASDDFRFAASVAAFGMILRDSPHRGIATFSNAARWASSALGADAGGERGEFVGLVRLSEALVR